MRWTVFIVVAGGVAVRKWQVGERGRIMIAYHRCEPKNGGIKALLEYFGAGSRLAMKCATLCDVALRFHRGCFMGA